MDQIPQALLFLGLIPVLILFYISLRGYEEIFHFKNVFITLVIGMIIGVIAIIIEANTAAVAVLFIILYPLLEQLFKTMILNLRRFQGRKVTVIYGLSLGLGFGSIFILLALILLYMGGSVDTFSLVLTVLGSLGIIMLHGATGLYIGFGVYSYKLIKYVLLSILLHIPVTAWIYITTEIERGYLQLAIFPYGILLYLHATTKIMPKILTNNITSGKRKK
ncbi:MAG: protease PrsW [Thermoplasmatales archaeon]|nr:MAG: protease PrsW [Thermoplasmatales archaeon]